MAHFRTDYLAPKNDLVDPIDTPLKTPADRIVENSGIGGLTDASVAQSRLANGRNEVIEEHQTFLTTLLELFKEPMIILLMIASVIYIVTGNTGDAFFMLSAIVVVTGISLFQESRSRNALQKLKSLTQPQCRVIRNGRVSMIPREDLVVGDCIIVEEGTSIPADGTVIQSNDFAVNEAILTGESQSVEKSRATDRSVFQGTTVVSGLAICEVTAVGRQTSLGKIGETLRGIDREKTPLQRQVGDFVKKMAVAGSVVFLIVWAINFFRSYDLLQSLLKALTLAMSILPEEIPVAFTTFMALGAWRLMKLGVVIKNTSTVETLGSASIICLDKTGTITENRMKLAKVFTLSSGNIYDVADVGPIKPVLTAAMWASEPIPFDPMEVALHDAYAGMAATDERSLFSMVHEYPLGGKPPMMTHVFQDSSGARIIAAKGAPEALMNVATLTTREQDTINGALDSLTQSGYRVLGVGMSSFSGDRFPEQQQQLTFTFLGLVAFLDPPKANISTVFESFYKAGIQIKIITGDNAATTSTIAKQIRFDGYDRVINSDALMSLTEDELKAVVMDKNIFTRMYPDAKLRIVNALKANGYIVAMTGDGVNDAPALKAAHISIAMGRKGSETAKEVSSLVLSDDDLAKMVDAIAMGRRIYTNLKKAIQYIISIHIPIIFTVLLPLVLGWVYPSIFTPVHVIFLELVMGPTCSIIYENEPIEGNAMTQKPRPFSLTFFNWRELSLSIIQGAAITLGTLLIYQYAVHELYSERTTRTMVFASLITSNIFLTLVNRSFYYSMITTLGYRNRLIAVIIGITLVLTACFIYLPPLARFFLFEKLSWTQLLIALIAGTVSVAWFELYKFYKRRRSARV